MTIAAYGAGAQATLRATTSFASTKSDLSTYETQLSTGQVSQTYAGLGTSASKSLSLSSKISNLGAYASNITDAQLRVNLMSTGLQQIATLAGSMTTGLPTTASDTIGRTNSQVSAADGMSQVIDILNTDVNGRYLFAGRAADTEPVASYDRIMGGDPSAGQAGVKQVIAERQAADLGNGKGRLTTASIGSAAILAEDVAGSPFGFKLGTVSTSGTGMTVATAASPTAAARVTVGSQPSAGDAISVTLNLPDGTTQTLKLVAGTAPSTADGATYFAIGATTDDTAANIAAALGTAVSGAATTTLSAASALRGAQDFFSDPPHRVGPYPSTATALVAGTSADTVIWYKGTTSASPRDTAPVRVGDDASVGVGAEASESAIRTVLVNYAALNASSFPATDSTSNARYEALQGRVAANLSFSDGARSVEDVVSDLSGASGTLGQAADRVKGSTAQFQDMADSILGANPTEVAAKLLAVQTKLSASYQVTSTISKLSLVNYL